MIIGACCMHGCETYIHLSIHPPSSPDTLDGRLVYSQSELSLFSVKQLTRQGSESLRCVVLDTDNPRCPRLRRHSLELHLLPLLLSFPLLRSIRFDAVEELLTAFRVRHVLDPDIHALLHVASVHDLVAYHAHSAGSDVVHNAGFAVVN